MTAELYMRRPTSLLVLVLFVAACSDNGVADACPRDGVVLPTMRDVERDAEGAAYAAFGPLPDHIADFGRTMGVRSLLTQVWADATAACPDLPADSVAVVNDALAALDAAILAKDARAAAYAGNDIHLQMAPLFGYFNRLAPIEVERMDATFLRIGLDAWYGDWAGHDADLASLQTDWAVVKKAASGKVPMCHRVAGTQSVIGDIDEILAILVAAAGTKDVDTVQLQSEAGLAAVDILELLFDCPPDGAAPSTGLGSPCKAGSECDAGQVCDLANAGGRCAPDPSTTNIGAPCTTTVDCGTYERDACNNEIGDGFPGGYCTLEPCDDVRVCSPGATCVALPFETPACLKSCAKDSDCRGDEGYVCQLFPTMPPGGFGPSELACAFACTSDDECTSPLTCELASGKCIP